MGRTKAQKRRRKKTQKSTPLFDHATQPTIAEKPNQLILRTAGQVAAHFSTSLRTVQNWMNDGMRDFCTPAQPGHDDGHFPVEEIKAWRARKRGAVLTHGQDDPAMRAMKVELEELKLKEKRFELERKTGGMVTLDEAIRLSARAAAASKAKLSELRPRLEMIMPQEIDADLKFKYLNSVDELLQDIFEELGRELLALGDEE